MKIMRQRRFNRRRTDIPKGMDMNQALEGVKQNRFYIDSVRTAYGFDWIHASLPTIREVDLSRPFEVQRVTFGKKRSNSNIHKYSGKTCDVILASNRTRKGPNVYLYLKEV